MPRKRRGGVPKQTAKPQNVRLTFALQDDLEELAAKLDLSRSELLRASASFALPRFCDMDPVEVKRLGALNADAPPATGASATT